MFKNPYLPPFPEQDQAEIAQFNPEQRQNYERSLKYYRDLKNVVDTSFEEGKAEGKAEGWQEGLTEGILAGKRATARHMLAKGFEISLIAELTGLSPQDVISCQDAADR